MWKLTITQKRKSEYSDNMIEESVRFYSDDIYELVGLVLNMGENDGVVETAYKIESVKEGEQND